MGRRWLLVDVGNCRVKWGWVENGGPLLAGTPFPSDPARLPDELTRHWAGLERPDAVHVANVGGADRAAVLGAWTRRHWNIAARFVEVQAQALGVVNGYQQPEQLGVDRWVGLIALRRDYALPACLADCGTALTLDVLDHAGRHLGGLIAPGPTSMKRALLRETRGIREFAEALPEFPGRSTAAGVEAGVLWACAGLVEKTVRALGERFGRSPTLVLSGGDGASVGRCLALPHQLAPDLVLRGLRLVAENPS